MKHFFYLFTFLIFTSFSDPVTPKPVIDYPKGYFQPPVAHAMSLSGSFGELRANHFHSGIDISPGIKLSNEPIYAAAEGYVSRISVRGGGYGQALYIAHPNGYTTLYAHLEKYNFTIDTFLKRKQYESESFEQDIVLQPNELPILRGQEIGLMGNKGHSFGQHLHFEIRDTKTDNALNPLLFGFPVADYTAPTMRSLKVYFLNEKKEIIDNKTIEVIKKGGNYAVLGDTVFTPASPESIQPTYIAFGLKTYDKMEGKSGDNGIFTLDLKQNDSLRFTFKAETISFGETRYLNAHLDYQAEVNNQGFYHRAFVLPGNKLSMYENVVNDGLIPINSGANKISLTSTDAASNTSVLEFYLSPKNFSIAAKPKNYNYILPFNEPSIIQGNGVKFFFPKGCFYTNTYLNFAPITEGYNYGTYSSTFNIGNSTIPLHYMMTVSVKPLNLPDSLREKAFVAYCPRENGMAYNSGGTWGEDGSLTCKSNRFGSYCIMVDAVPPSITPVRFQYDMRKFSKMSFKIKDNFESSGNAEGLKYRATVDDQWILMELDDKNDLIYYQFDDRVSEGEHTLKIEVTDSKKNTRQFESKFKR